MLCIKKAQEVQKLIPVYPEYPMITRKDTMDIFDWIPAGVYAELVSVRGRRVGAGMTCWRISDGVIT